MNGVVATGKIAAIIKIVVSNKIARKILKSVIIIVINEKL